LVTVLSANTAPAQEQPAPDGVQVDPEKGTLDGSPLDDLPEHIKLLSDTGVRPDWSPNGRQLVILEGAPLGDVAIIDVKSGRKRTVTKHFEHRGFARAYFLHNGDLLLCGPASGPQPSPERPEAGRFTGVMSVLRAPFKGEPQPLGASCWEGMATSDRSMRIAWNRSDIDYTDDNLGDRVVNGISEIWSGVVRYRAGRAYLSDVERVAERNAVSPARGARAAGLPRAEGEGGHLHRVRAPGRRGDGRRARQRNRQRFGDELLEQPGVRGSRGNRS
jgi:hypothetical protein